MQITGFIPCPHIHGQWNVHIGIARLTARHCAAAKTPQGEIAGFLPHRYPVQVQRSTAHWENNIIAHTPECYQEKICHLRRKKKHRGNTPVLCSLIYLWLLLYRNLLWYQLLSPESTCAFMTEWLIWLHTFCVNWPLWLLQLDNEEILLASWNPPLQTISIHMPSGAAITAKRCPAGFAIMVFLITGPAWL